MSDDPKIETTKGNPTGKRLPEGEKFVAVTEDGRRIPGRVVYSRGPIVRTLEVVSVIAALLAVATLVYTYVNVSDDFTHIQQAREASAFDTCRIFKVVIDASAQQQRHSYPIRDKRGRVIGTLTVPDQSKQTAMFEHRAGLTDCRAYARKVRSGTLGAFH